MNTIRQRIEGVLDQYRNQLTNKINAPKLEYKQATDAIIATILESLPKKNDYRFNSFAHKLYAPSEDYAKGFKVGYQKAISDSQSALGEE